MNLKNIALTTKSAEVEFAGLKGFSVTIAAVSRQVSHKLRKESEITRINAALRVPETELDETLFLEKFAAAAIKGWKGLTYEHLAELMLVDLSGVEDVKAEVEYSQENAVTLLTNSPVFDTWVNQHVFSLESFRDKPTPSNA